MADKIRILIEGMMPDLLTFIKKGVFTKQEGKEILKDRENLEYSLTKKSAGLKEFLKAIQFEYELEQKRRKRFADFKIKKTTYKDFSIIRRIIQLYDKATHKYKYNISLWKEYLTFCYTIQSKKCYFKAITNALKFNSQELDLWLLASYYEFEINRSPFKARSIFFKALKILGKNEKMWCEYFKFEIKFLENIIERQKIIQPMDIEEIDDNDDLKQDFLGFGGQKNLEKSISTANVDESQGLLKTIYETCKEQFADNQIKMQLRLLQEVQLIDKDWLQNLKTYIMDDIKKTVGIQNYLVDLFLIKSNINLVKGEESAFQNIFRDIDLFLTEFQQQNNQIEQFYSRLLELIIENRQNFQFLNKNLSFYQNLKKHTQSLNIKFLMTRIQRHFLTQQFFQNIIQKKISEVSPSMLLTLSKVLRLFEDVQKLQENIRILLNIFKSVKVDSSQRENFFLNLINALSLKGVFFHDIAQKLFNYILDTLNKQTHEIVLQSLFDYLQSLQKNHEVQQFIESLYKKLTQLNQNCPLSVYLKYSENLISSQKINDAKILLNKLVIWYPELYQSWIELIKFELQHGLVTNCPKIYQKAVKSIHNIDNFQQEYDKIMN